MKKFLMLVVTVSLSALAVFAQQPLTIDLMLKMNRLSDFTISADGKRIAYSVGHVDMDANNVRSVIYLIDINSGEAKTLTDKSTNHYHPQFSQDGNSLYMMTDIDGKTQVVIMNLVDKSIKPVTQFGLGVNNFLVSPSENMIAIETEGYPDLTTVEENIAKMDAESNRKSTGMVFNQLPYRVWSSWKDNKRSQVWLYDIKKGRATLATMGDFDTPPIALGGYSDYAFSPDESKLVFTRNPDKNVAWSTNNDVFSYDIQSGRVTNLTAANKANDNNGLYSPDGKMMAYRAMKTPGFEADQTHLMLMDIKTSTVQNLTENLDLSVGQIQWGSDSQHLFFAAEEKGYDVLFRLNIQTAITERLLEKVSISRFWVQENQIFYMANSSRMPNELFVLDMKSDQTRQLTQLNTELLTSIRMTEPEEFWYKGADNRDIHSFAYLPPDFQKTKKYPMVYLVHGGPQGAWNNGWSHRWNPQVWAANGWIVVTPNPTGSTGYGQQLTNDITQDWGGKVFEDLIKGVDASIEKYPQIDENRMAAAGASYGGYMMNWFQGHTDRFVALVSHAGLYNMESFFGATEELWFPIWEMGGTPWENPEMYKKWSPSTYVKNFKTPTLVIHGAKDFRVPETQAFEYFSALQYMGVESKLLYFPDENHWILKPQNSKQWHETIFEWLGEKFL